MHSDALPTERALSRMEKLLAKVLSGHADPSIRFTELCTLLQRLGFNMRVRGSHHMFRRPGLPRPINLQRMSSAAKQYQVQQVRDILIEYRLTTLDGGHDGD
jgi:hypothetical protein